MMGRFLAKEAPDLCPPPHTTQAIEAHVGFMAQLESKSLLLRTLHPRVAGREGVRLGSSRRSLPASSCLKHHKTLSRLLGENCLQRPFSTPDSAFNTSYIPESYACCCSNGSTVTIATDHFLFGSKDWPIKENPCLVLVMADLSKNVKPVKEESQ